ncbi:MAG TPA: class I SAM-dependent methyltransferase [Thermoanaerobaculia bacterium]|nr:class I SAM-dependent methyltransferase [Thermoanaerobaculia bacterium]
MRDMPSATALMIAESFVFLARQPRFGALFPERSIDWFSRFAHEAHGERGCSREFYAAFWARVAAVREALSVPGIRLHYVVRKRYIEEKIRAALSEGFEQIVVVGAGFDTLALRLAEEFPEADFFELDHPATQEVKRRGLDAEAPANLTLVPVDLRKQMVLDALREVSSFDPDRRTTFIMEGLLMYLSAAEVDQLLRSISASGGERRVIFSFMERQPRGKIGFRRSTFLTNLWLAWKGEPFRWGLKEQELAPFLDTRGLTLSARSTSQLLRDRYLHGALSNERLAEGEHIVVADKS